MYISIQKIKYLSLLIICLPLTFACQKNSKTSEVEETKVTISQIQKPIDEAAVDSVAENPEIVVMDTVKEDDLSEKVENKPEPKVTSNSIPKPKGFQLKVGADFPDYELKDIHGKVLSSKELKGKVIVYNFWFTSCKPCRDEIPELNLLVKQFSPRDDVVFIAPTFESKSKIEKFTDNQPFNYHLIDNVLPFNQSVGVKTYPVHLIIDKENKVHTIVTQQYPTIKDIMANYIFNAIDGRPNETKYEG